MSFFRTIYVFCWVTIFVILLASCSSSRRFERNETEYEYTYRSYDSIITSKWERLTPSQLEAEFEKRKGTFMLPVIDISTINVHYGTYHFQNEKNVTLQQRGVKILCNFNNVNACSIFYGKVSVVFKSGDLYNVLVRHGRYISGYFGLYNVCVSAGDFVVPRQAVGEVYNDNEGKSMLQFQLRKETETLNPEEWFRAE